MTRLVRPGGRPEPPESGGPQASWRCRTPDVTIHVNPERSDLVQTRMIEGTRYILIRANEGVEVNGVSIQIS